jgi:hypothetical protein
MKTNLLLFVLCIFLFNACSVGVKKDLLIGLKVTNNGLSFEESYLMMDSAKINSNEFPLGKTIFVYFTGLDGFTLKDGKVNFGASISITDEKGNKVMEKPDLFPSSDQSGYTPDQVKVIYLNFNAVSPLVPGSKYFWKSKIWDKNSKGTIDAELEFTVK